MVCSDRDYDYLREVVLTQSAKLIDPSRNALFDTRLAPIARLAGVSNLHDFVKLLQVEQPTHLHRAVAEAMTLSETSFFRDETPFEAIRSSVLPQLIHARESTQRLRIWSAATSTGQEAFSVAILIASVFPELTTWDVKIIGTDISRQAIEYAQRGRFRPAEIHRGLSPELLLQYFSHETDEWVISPRIASMCDFHYANLCEPFPTLPLFDLILLRNVLMYFPQQDRTAILSNVHGQLAPEGYLLLGSSEQAEDSTSLFHVEVANASYFYRPVNAI